MKRIIYYLTESKTKMTPPKNIHLLLEQYADFEYQHPFPKMGGWVICSTEYLHKENLVDFFGASTVNHAIHHPTHLVIDVNLRRAQEAYESLRAGAAHFIEYLSAWVEQDSFIAEWSACSQRKRDQILFFDPDSYSILRRKLEKEALYATHWSALAPHVQVVDMEALLQTMGLTEDFKEFPYNSMQFLKLKKSLTSLGYSTSALDFPRPKDEATYQQEMAQVACRHKTNQEMDALYARGALILPTPFCFRLDFFNQKEDALTASTRKMGT